MPETGDSTLPLFPLQTVLFPGGLLQLKVFEARYLDLVSSCLREGRGFGVVCLKQGSEVQLPGEKPARFERVGVMASLDEVDSEQPGILRVRCTGGRRFEVLQSQQAANGLWHAAVQWRDDDEVAAPTEALAPSAQALANAIATIEQQGPSPFAEPYRLDDAGWVANRWCELLPVPLAAKQKLMELDEPLVRLQLVDEFLRSKGVI
jgi:Lon protease-like protein